MPYVRVTFSVVILTLLHIDVADSKLPKAPEDIRSLDSIRSEYIGSPKLRLHNVVDPLVSARKLPERKSFVIPTASKKTNKAKDTLRKSSVPHGAYLDSNSMHSSLEPTRRESNGKLGATGTGSTFGYPKRPETEAERAARLNKQFEKMVQFTTMLGHVDSFLYDRAKSVVKTLHRMMGDSRELIDPLDFETNELRRRRHSNDFHRGLPTESRALTNEARYYEEPTHAQQTVAVVPSE